MSESARCCSPARGRAPGRGSLARCAAPLLVVVIGCGGCRSNTRSETAARSPTDKSGPPKTAKLGRCERIIADYARVLERAPLTCVKDADCGCYNGGVGPRAGCGGVAERATLSRLDALWKKFRAAGCRYTQHCGPWQCRPLCRRGKCALDK